MSGRWHAWGRRGLLPMLLLMAMLGAQAAPRVSVLTCGPGDDFYLLFGHSALRVQDTAQGVDYVYNYGTFDFDTPHFYLKFARGQLDYCLSRTTFDHFVSVYAYEGRSVDEQVLALTEQEASNLALMLEVNFQPDYRYYHYDFFRDNCATRVRDMVENALAHRHVEYTDDLFALTYRQAVDLYTEARPDMRWWSYGTNLLLGMRCDQAITTRQAMYMPLLMQVALRDATVEGAALVSETNPILSQMPKRHGRTVPPVAVFSVLFAVVAVLSIVGHNRGWRLVWLDRTLFIVGGVAGLFLCFMWLATDHWCTPWNWNVLWLSPLMLLLAIRPQQSPRWSLWLQAGMLVLAVVMSVVGWPQRIGVESLPLILMLLVRVWVRIRVRG